MVYMTKHVFHILSLLNYHNILSGPEATNINIYGIIVATIYETLLSLTG